MRGIEDLRKKKRVFADTEHDGLDPHTAKLMSFQYQIEDQDPVFLDLRKEEDRKSLSSIFSQDNLLFIFHNASNDYNMLRSLMPKSIYVACTMITEQILQQGIRDEGFSLNDLTYDYCDVFLDKNVRSQFIGWGDKPFTQEMIDYAMDDIKYMKTIFDSQMSRIEELELIPSWNLEMHSIKPIADMSFYGIPFNFDIWMSAGKENESIIKKAEDSLDQIIIEEYPKIANKYHSGQVDMFGSSRKLNLKYNSSTQMKEVFKKMGIELVDKDGEVTTAANELRIAYPNWRFTKHYTERSFRDKRRNTYGKKWKRKIHPITKRIHSAYKQVLVTSRLSSKNPNMQNIPADNAYRNAFKAPDGQVILSADYSGQESKITAQLSQDKNLLRFYKDRLFGGDLHSYVASLMFEVDVPPKIEDDPEAMERFNNSPHKHLRNSAKPLNFSIIYGATPASLAHTLSVDIKKAEELYNKYLDAFPGLKDWFQYQKDMMWENGYITLNLTTKRKVFIPDYQRLKDIKDKKGNAETSKWERNSINYPVQGTAAEMVKYAMVKIRSDIESEFDIDLGDKNPSSQLILQVHDELECLAQDKVKERTIEIMENRMEEAGYLFCPDLPSMKPVVEIQKQWSK